MQQPKFHLTYKVDNIDFEKFVDIIERSLNIKFTITDRDDPVHLFYETEVLGMNIEVIKVDDNTFDIDGKSINYDEIFSYIDISEYIKSLIDLNI